MPPRTAKVDRSTVWGNPFKVGEKAKHPVDGKVVEVKDKDQAISLFKLYLETPSGNMVVEKARAELRGLNLACWCKSGDACHGDALLAAANGDAPRRQAA